MKWLEYDRGFEWPKAKAISADEKSEFEEGFEGNPMFTFNGVGTRFYGKRDKDSDGWYTTTQFFCLVYFPIIPLGCYRVKPIKREGWGSVLSTQYESYPIDANIQQARNVLLLAYLPAALILVLINIYG